MNDLMSRTDADAHDDTHAPDLDPAAASDADAPVGALEVRRRTLLCGVIALAAAVVAVAYLTRALGDGSWVDWAVTALTAGLGVLHLLAVLDGRTPLLVADTHGVRLRTGREWRGLSWSDLECVEHLPRRGLLRDGHVLVIDRGGDQTPVALSLTTRLVGVADGGLADRLATLAGGRCDVVEVDPHADDAVSDDASDTTADDVHPAEADAADHEPTSTFTWAPLGAATAPTSPAVSDHEVDDSAADPAADDATDEHPVVVEPVAREAAEEPVVDEPAAEPAAEEPAAEEPSARPWAEPATDLQPAAPPSPLRSPVAAARSETLASRVFSAVIGANALRRDPRIDTDHETTDPLPELEQLRRPAEPDEDEVRVLAGGAPAAPAVAPSELVEGWDADPADAADTSDDADDRHGTGGGPPGPPSEPVIGPVLAAARGRLGLGIDQIADRTRIRAHVVEAMEVDDFAPCGGDFYARGHLRTLARVLGVDAAPLLAAYDERYADAPVDPRRVFQADPSSGAGGALRSTRGGPNWTVLVAAVMAVVLVWSIARLIMDGPAPTPDTPVLNQSGGLHRNDAKGAAVPITLTAAGGGATVQVRDASGQVVFDGELAFGQTADLDAVPPVKVTSSDGSVTASVDGAPAEALGATGEDTQKTLVAP